MLMVISGNSRDETTVSDLEELKQDLVRCDHRENKPVAAHGWSTLAVVGVCLSCERSEPIVPRTLATEQRVARRRGSAAGRVARMT